MWYMRDRIPVLNFPVPWRLPYGGWFLAYGDVVGFGVVARSFLHRYYDLGEWKFISRYLEAGMVYIDIGANQGYFTILAAKQVRDNGSVFAFEPSPREFRRLRRNLRLNGCNNVTLESHALGSYQGFTDFHMCLGSQGSFSSIQLPGNDVTSPKRLIQVPITTLDSYVKRSNIRSVDLIKMDVEGAELEVLKGGLSVLTGTKRPVWMCELEDGRTRQWGYKARNICEVLAGYEYTWYSITIDGRLRYQPPREEYNENLVAVPNESIPDLRKRLLIEEQC
jgi:FkbM family methyltransferase